MIRLVNRKKKILKRSRILTLMAVIAMMMLLVGGCGSSASVEQDNTVVRMASMKGPTSMGLVKMYEDGGYDYSVVGTADEITPLLLKGELDVAAVPANLASVLYNKSEGEIQALAINALGVLYIVEKNGNTVTDIASLKGKTILATGKGTTPEQVMNYLLTQAGLNPEEDVSFVWKSEASEVVASMLEMDSAIALLPQPYVTVVSAQMENMRIAVSLTESWNALNNGSTLVTGVIVGRKQFITEHPGTIEKLLMDMADSADYVNANPDEASELIEKYGIVAKAPIAKKALPYCNICCITGKEMKDALGGYLKVLFEEKAESVGGALPNDEFYYE